MLPQSRDIPKWILKNWNNYFYEGRPENTYTEVLNMAKL